MRKSLHALALFLICSSAFAVSIEPSSLERAVQSSDLIAHVRVTEGKALFFRRDEFGRIQPCGGVYKADVLNALKGEASQLEFGINFNLMLTPGSEYLLFLDSRGGLGIEARMFQPADYEECSSDLPSLMARWRYSSTVEWALTDSEEWLQLVTHPYGIALEDIAPTSDYKYLLDEYVANIEKIVAGQAGKSP